MANRYGIGCFAVIAGAAILVLLSRIYANIRLGAALAFYVLALLVTFAVLNIIRESKGGQYDPLRDLWFTFISFAFLVIAAVALRDWSSIISGISTGVVVALIMFIWRPATMTNVYATVQPERVEQIYAGKSCLTKKVKSLSIAIPRDKLLLRFTKPRLGGLLPLQKVDKVELVFKPFYLVRCTVKAESGFAFKRKKEENRWAVEAMIDARTNDIFGLDENINTELLPANEICIEEPIINQESAVRRATKFIKFQVSPSRYRTIPDIVQTESEIIYRPFWLIFFSKENFKLVPADNLEVVRRR